MLWARHSRTCLCWHSVPVLILYTKLPRKLTVRARNHNTIAAHMGARCWGEGLLASVSLFFLSLKETFTSRTYIVPFHNTQIKSVLVQITSLRFRLLKCSLHKSTFFINFLYYNFSSAKKTQTKQKPNQPNNQVHIQLSAETTELTMQS